MRTFPDERAFRNDGFIAKNPGGIGPALDQVKTAARGQPFVVKLR